MQHIHDPFTYLLNEIRAHDTGLRRWHPGERDHYLRELLADEAEEIAWGRRHITVVHGPIRCEAEAEALDTIVCDLLDLIGNAWHRFGGIADYHFTLTIDGPNAEEVLRHALDLANLNRPSHWQVLATAIVEVSR